MTLIICIKSKKGYFNHMRAVFISFKKTFFLRIFFILYSDIFVLFYICCCFDININIVCPWRSFSSPFIFKISRVALSVLWNDKFKWLGLKHEFVLPKQITATAICNSCKKKNTTSEVYNLITILFQVNKKVWWVFITKEWNRNTI